MQAGGLEISTGAPLEHEKLALLVCYSVQLYWRSDTGDWSPAQAATKMSYRERSRSPYRGAAGYGGASRYVAGWGTEWFAGLFSLRVAVLHAGRLGLDLSGRPWGRAGDHSPPSPLPGVSSPGTAAAAMEAPAAMEAAVALEVATVVAAAATAAAALAAAALAVVVLAAAAVAAMTSTSPTCPTPTSGTCRPLRRTFTTSTRR